VYKVALNIFKQILKGNLLKIVNTDLNEMKLAKYQVWLIWSFRSLFLYYKTFTAYLGVRYPELSTHQGYFPSG
jgi:hypothetical protein